MPGECFATVPLSQSRPQPGPLPPANAHTEKCSAHTFLPNHLGMWFCVHKDHCSVREKGGRISGALELFLKHKPARSLFPHILAKRNQLPITWNYTELSLMFYQAVLGKFLNTLLPCFSLVIFVHSDKSFTTHLKIRGLDK